VATYPTIAFHKELQRLAVGTFEGAIIMYDLKTSTRLYVIEAHQKSLSGLSFSQDGRRLVSICLQDQMVKVWKTGVGLSAFLNFGGAPRQGGLLSSAVNGANTGSGGSGGTSSTGIGSVSTTLSTSTTTLGNSEKKTLGRGTAAYKNYEFGRVAERDPDSEAIDLALISFNWLTERSIKVKVGETSMSFDTT
jgi:WD40 repeat protein